LGLGGCQANSHQIHERTIDQYPYPNGQNFNNSNLDFNSFIATFRSLAGTEDITDYGEEVEGPARQISECYMGYYQKMVECNTRMLGWKGCECNRYSEEGGACAAIQLYFCANKLCEIMRRVYRDLWARPLDLECPSVWDKDAWQTYKKMGEAIFGLSPLSFIGKTPCEFYRQVKNGGLDYCNDNTPSVSCDGVVTTPTLPPSEACDAYMEKYCPPPGPQVFHDDWFSRWFGCWMGRYISSGGNMTDEDRQRIVEECFDIHNPCPTWGGGGDVITTDTGCPTLTCDEIKRILVHGEVPKRCVGKPFTNNKLPLVGPYDDQGPISPVPENCEIPEP
jgi:hypothetical protein